MQRIVTLIAMRFPRFQMWNFGNCFGTSKTPPVHIITEPFLPLEIITEILSWLPVKSLAKSKCVCKEWYAITRTRCFIEKHMTRSGPTCYMFNKKKLLASTPEDGLKDSFKFICGCDGLLLQKNNATCKYRIRNRTTRQTLDLPDIPEGSFDMTFSYILSMDRYKLVCVYDDKEKTGSKGWGILTLGIDDIDLSRRSLSLPKMDELNNRREKGSLVSAGVAVHYVVTIKSRLTSYIPVICLDLETECFTSISLPEGRFSDLTKLYPIDWNGKLSFAQMTEVGLSVLVLEDYKKHKWGERMIIVPLRDPKGHPVVNQNFIPLLARSGILYFRLKDNKFYIYYMGSKKWTVINAREGYSIVGTCYVVSPSLITLKGMK